MRTAILCIAAALLWGSPAAAEPPKYADLVARAEQGDATLDYTALRMSYARSDTYDPYAMQTRPLFAAAWKAFTQKDCDAAVASARAMFKINYISVPMHFVVSDCLRQAGDAAGADREAAIARGLADSLVHSGDGKSAATAYTVVNLSEEGFVLSLLGFKEERQSLLNDGGHQYDLLEGKDEKTGEPRGAYFNIDAIFAGVAKSFSPPQRDNSH
ncbi:MAG TPA: DUF4919 domain-containing protein [Rhizomicrobium sp.]